MVNLDPLREAMRAEAERTSYRRLAEASGLSPRALRMFVDREGVPRAKTVHMVRQWHARGQSAEPTAEEAVAFIRRLLIGITGVRNRARAMGEIVDFFEGLYVRGQVPPPAWIRTIREK